MQNNFEPQRFCFNTSTLYLLALFIISSFISIITPPFQSPDEFEHIKRAYMLGNGEIILKAPTGLSSSGMINSGLAQYMSMYSLFPFHQEQKVTGEIKEASGKIQWQKQSESAPALGMAYYFPAIYAIHTITLKAGEKLQISVDATYRLTRLLVLITTCCLLGFAFRLYEPSQFVLALLFIPMSLFQFSSASLDGLATALSILMVSIFLKITTTQNKSTNSLFYLFIICWLLVASSRIQLFPMILLGIIIAQQCKNLMFFISSIFSATLVIIWQLIVMKTIVDGRVNLGATTAEIGQYYFSNPARLFEVLTNTLVNSEIMRGYFSSFFGLLGWLDTPFKGSEYLYFLAIVSFIGMFSFSLKLFKLNRLSTLSLVISAIGSISIIFLAMLLTWTPHPAPYIEGVQGRYFLIPLILCAYAFSAYKYNFLNLKQKISSLFLILLILFSFVKTSDLLLDRYYVQSVSAAH